MLPKYANCRWEGGAPQKAQISASGALQVCSHVQNTNHPPLPQNSGSAPEFHKADSSAWKWLESKCNKLAYNKLYSNMYTDDIYSLEYRYG
jgi:hypothetical protein